jgi:hypothetical protein
MFGGMFYSCAQGNLQQNPAAQFDQKPGITVAGTTLPAFYVQQSVEGQMGQLQRMLASSPQTNTPDKEVEYYGFTIDTLSNQAAYVALAQKNGVDLSDAGLTKVAEKAVEEGIASEREQAILGKQLKENATEKEWQDYFKKQNKKSIEEVKKERLGPLQEQLSDPDKRKGVLIQLAQPALMQALSAKINLTDDDVRRANSSVTYKRIQFKSEVPGKPAAERAEAVLKELKNGLKFETAIDRYSNELPAMNKKLSETTQSASGTQAQTDPAFTALATLKAGEISGVVDVPEGKAIYKVISWSAPPADFDKKKETYRKTAIASRVQTEVTKQLKELKDNPANIVIDMPSYALAYRYFRLTGGPMGGGIIDPAKAKALYEDAGKVIEKGTDNNMRLAALVRYSALQKTLGDPTMTPEVMRKREIEAIRAVLDNSVNFTLRMRLVDLLIEEKDNAGASQELLNARQEISGTDENAVEQGRLVSAKRMQMKEKKILTAEAEQLIIEEQARWQKEKAESDKFAAEQKKEEEARRKEEEAAMKKAAEEAKKGASNAPTTPTSGTTTGTLPLGPTTGTATTGAATTGR